MPTGSLADILMPEPEAAKIVYPGGEDPDSQGYRQFPVKAAFPQRPPPPSQLSTAANPQEQPKAPPPGLPGTFFEQDGRIYQWTGPDAIHGGFVNPKTFLAAPAKSLHSDAFSHSGSQPVKSPSMQ